MKTAQTLTVTNWSESERAQALNTLINLPVEAVPNGYLVTVFRDCTEDEYCELIQSGFGQYSDELQYDSVRCTVFYKASDEYEVLDFGHFATGFIGAQKAF